MLGAFAYAIYIVLKRAEHWRQDKLVNGYDTLDEQPSHPLGVLCSAFMVYRGLQMYPKWIMKWAEVC